MFQFPESLSSHGRKMNKRFINLSPPKHAFDSVESLALPKIKSTYEDDEDLNYLEIMAVIQQLKSDAPQRKKVAKAKRREVD